MLNSFPFHLTIHPHSAIRVPRDSYHLVPSKATPGSNPVSVCRWLKRINCVEELLNMQIESIFLSLLSGFSSKSSCHGRNKPALHERSVCIIVFVGSQPSKTMAGRKGEWQQCNEFKFAFGLSNCFLAGLCIFSSSVPPSILAELSAESGNPG